MSLVTKLSCSQEGQDAPRIRVYVSHPRQHDGLHLTVPTQSLLLSSSGPRLGVAGAEDADVACRHVREGEQARRPEHRARARRVLRGDHVLEQQQPDLLGIVACVR